MFTDFSEVLSASISRAMNLASHQIRTWLPQETFWFENQTLELDTLHQYDMQN
jgi:hypothetical protein